jgi:plastocyanin
MKHVRLAVVATALVFAIMIPQPAAWAASVDLTVTDTDGKPVADAIVTVAPAAGTIAAASGAFVTPHDVIIDQRDETFIPYVVAVRRGGTVTFRNSDQTRHQVYSFAAIKEFEFVLRPGESSPPVQFPLAGVAILGCNIHDQMIAYVYVTDAPWATVTRDSGRARIDGLPAGNFVVTVWHPRLRPGAKEPTRSLTLPTAESATTMAVAVLPPRIHGDDDLGPY